MRVRLWFVRETGLARRYCKLPESRDPGADSPRNPNYVWLPRDACSQTSKRPAAAPGGRPEHTVEVEDWVAEREGL